MMPSGRSEEPQLEIAHVLFMDLVSFSLLTAEEQAARIEQLQQIIRWTPEFQRMEKRGELLCLATGDGMALVFFRDPVAPARCAMEATRAMKLFPALQVRMGVSSGPVSRFEDINTDGNVVGGGINSAQRVMDCADAGQILVSGSVADTLNQLNDWPELLHDLGECEVKHGQRIRLFNLYTDDVGNPALPEKLRRRTPPVEAPGRAEQPKGRVDQRGQREEGASTTAGARPARVALIYKRHAQPDERLLGLLESRLQAEGHEIFIDRHLSIGVEWAEEIVRQVRRSDAVIPLLSAASVHSEMLTYEVNVAHEAAQQQNGRPRLLPVRVNYTGPLPDPLESILGPLHYSVWEGPQDDERLVSQLVHALQQPPSVTPARLEPVGGAVPLASRLYLVRPTDEEFRAAIERQDSIVLVKGARQMGKTSLLARGLQQAREAGARVVLTDFQKLNDAHLESAETLLRALAEWIARQLDLDVDLDQSWKPRTGANINFEWFLRREVLKKLPAPLVWGLDEVDQLFTRDYAQEVFGLFRSWHNERALDPTGPWARLTLAIAYATEAHLFITNVNQSPFNVGTRLTLDDFTVEQVAELNGRYGCPLRDDSEVDRFYRLVGGHPYLVQRGLHEMVSHGLSIAGFEAEADRDEGILGDHLRRILVVMAGNPELLEVVRGILRGKVSPTPEEFYRLRSAGVMAGDSAREVRPRCQLYASYLTRHLL